MDKSERIGEKERLKWTDEDGRNMMDGTGQKGWMNGMDGTEGTDEWDG